MATIYDIAKKAGVSITTVSRVINNHPYVQEETRQRVKQVLEETNFIPNSNASSLVRKTTNTLAVMIPDITNNFFTTLLRGIEDKANENGFAVIFGNTDENSSKEYSYLQTFMERRVDGLLIDVVLEGNKNLKSIITREIPVVLIDRQVNDLPIDYVGSNNSKGAEDLVYYLIELGHRQIALISGAPEISVYRQRLEGYKTAQQKAGLIVDPKMIFWGEKPNQETGYRLTKKLLQNPLRPTAIFAANNFLAIGAFRALHEAHLEVPKDMSIVCFDAADTDATLNPFFTSMVQPSHTMGEMAVELLMRRLKNKKSAPTKVILEPQFFRRESTAKVEMERGGESVEKGNPYAGL
jgi:LacI family transcriptional regulator